MSILKSVEAKKVVEELRNNPSQALVIHYSRQDLMDNEMGVKTPRIVAIMIKSIDKNTNRVILTYKELLRNMGRKHKRFRRGNDN